MRRAPRLNPGLATVALVGAMTLAGAATAQTAAPVPTQNQGAHYLSWPGRTVPPGAEATAASPRRSNRVIPHGGAAAQPPAPAPARRTLTPASAWLQPAAPQPPAPVAAPPPAPAPVAARPLVPEYLPEQGGRGQPAPAEAAYPAAPTQPSDDPMAPRRDAPIFRMQQSAPPPTPETVPPAQAPTPAPQAAPPAQRQVATVTANLADRPPQQGARYYSVHRQNGQTPDALAIPEPTYVDALAVTMTETPASQDLAQPDQGPTLIRDSQGRMRAQPAAPEGDYQ
ncbi:hypothetical protein [Brevundimonas lenta]|uniref:Uncharacterized protein n=1 Tax=Brevundimonas lenta TaxID=424796 RepID=A0A7W6JF11_9CAUL|nr:hypothetical protein [Brevundimonas lenta]MBB4083904.1 hypothetical protein [Brevundimonas lenta]